MNLFEKNFAWGKDLDGYVWGVKDQRLYPGGRVVSPSKRARNWADAVSIEFHHVRFETNAHKIDLVFSDLAVTEVSFGYAPFVIETATQ